MTTKTLQKTVLKLSREVSMLRAFVIASVGEEDTEGSYKLSFVKKIGKAVANEPVATYGGRGSLVRHLHKIRTSTISAWGSLC